MSNLMNEERIHLLPQHLANQIAAGEVIERPASVVKELVENSLDAGATDISIEIEKGGVQLIKIKDNGKGIHKEDLILALARHGTSKINDFEDLMHIKSLGFRGEALASIASISRINLVSCQKGQDIGWQISAEGSHLKKELLPVAHTSGTTITIQDLFFNTPARRKFLKSEKTEFSHIEETLKRLALSRFDLRLQLLHNQRRILFFSEAKTNISQEQRIAKLFSQSFVNESIKIEIDIQDLKLDGWLSLPSFSCVNTNLQYFYVNGRIVKDKIITHAIKQVYSEFLPSNKHPGFILFLNLDPALVDVNVHPTKHEIRFRESRLVHDFLVRALKNCLAPTHLKQSGEIDSLLNFSEPLVYETEPYNLETTNSLKPIDYATHNNQLLKSMAVAESSCEYELLLHPTNLNQQPSLGEAIDVFYENFLLAKKEDKLIVINITKAQELIIENEFAKKQDNNTLFKPLLFPVNLKFIYNHSEILITHQEDLLKLGFQVEALGPETLVLRQAPAFLYDLQWQEVFEKLVILFSEKNKNFMLIKEKIINVLASFMAKYIARNLKHKNWNQLLSEIEKLPLNKMMSKKIWHECSTNDLNQLFIN